VGAATGAGVGAAVLLGGCGSDRARHADETKPDVVADDGGFELREEFIPHLQAIASEYRSQYLPVHPAMRVAPTDCRAPVMQPSTSAASEGTAHGRKMYYLFASDARAFFTLAAEPEANVDAPLGLTLVKETWLVGGTASVAGEGLPPGIRGDLFIMTRMDEGTPGTDGGWMYATVKPTSLEVTAAGALGACIRCHEDAPHDRLFVTSTEEARSRLKAWGSGR
jgi:hypothetical protein